MREHQHVSIGQWPPQAGRRRRACALAVADDAYVVHPTLHVFMFPHRAFTKRAPHTYDLVVRNPTE